MENLDKISDKLILFKYDLKFSQANRQVLPDQDILQFIRHKALVSKALPQLINPQKSSFQHIINNNNNNSHRGSCDKSIISASNNTCNIKTKSKSTAVISPRLSSSFNPNSIQRMLSKKALKSVQKPPCSRLLSAFRKSSQASLATGLFQGHIDQSKILKFNRLTQLKDTDFKNVHGTLPVCSEDQGKLISIIRQIKRDADFLRRNSIMDYSLLIIVVKTPSISQPGCQQDSRIRQKAVKNYQYIEQLDDLLGKYYAILRSPSKSFTYILGIIDYLQLWNIQKQGEKGIKEYLNPEERGQQSAIPPRQYCQRFQNGIDDVFEVVQQEDEYTEQGSIHPGGGGSDQNRSISLMSNKFGASSTCSNKGKQGSGQLEMKNI